MTFLEFFGEPFTIEMFRLGLLDSEEINTPVAYASEATRAH
jgi:hypothetical protein